EEHEETEKGEEKEENEPVAKKRKTQKKEGKREMECPKCKNYRSTSVHAVMFHLRTAHRTTAFVAGFKFLCDCGYKSACAEHNNSECKLLNFKIIREERAGVKCIMCESHLSTIGSYSGHLARMHDTTPTKSGIHLQCACSARLASISASKAHKKICDKRQFTVQKNDED
ncbi:hypothetical protein PFISCL1PPCAC_21790, partial [Pristionchus fissidentatus]